MYLTRTSPRRSVLQMERQSVSHSLSLSPISFSGSERESSRGRRFFLVFFPREGPKSTASEGGKRNFATGSGGCNVASASTTARSRICKDFQQKADVRRAQLNCARLCFGRGICPFSSMYTLLRVKISRVIKMHNCVKVCFPLTFPKASSYIGSGDEVAIHYRWP